MRIEPPAAPTLRYLPLIALCLLLLALPAPAHAQPPAGVVSLALRAGYAGYFREGEWLPVRVDVRNDGGDLTGRLVVRPETSGDGIFNTYSAPVTLAAGARQTVFLYVTARAFAGQVRVELVADDGAVVAAERAALRGLQSGDRLVVVISESAVNAIDFTGVTVGSALAAQADIRLSDLPDRPAALDAVDVIAINDADTAALSAAQQDALTAWVVNGGHLIVGGGANWATTAAGIRDLLPFIPTGDAAIDSLDALASWLRLPPALDRQTVIAVGEVGAGGRALVSADGVPLLVRGTRGSGTVDFLAADPSAEPLRSWGGVGDLWWQLITSAAPPLGWSQGVVDWTSAAGAVEILPGYDALPDLLPLCGFLAAYIALVGPLNYLILSRLNRREWAWLTIPGLIVVFSAAAYGIGGVLRGTEATVTRLSLVRAWADSDTARLDMLVGLLSPRRTEYDLTALADGMSAPMLRPIPRPQPGGAGLLAQATGGSIDISQSDRFSAQNFTVDASFIAGFHASGAVARPPITGSASFAFDEIAGQQIVRGSVRSDAAFTLSDPVILARGVALRLSAPLAPGELVTFDLTLPGEGAPPPAFNIAPAGLPYFRAASFNNKQSALDILGADGYNAANAVWTFDTSAADQALRRRVLMLSALIDEPYGSAGRADRVYLAGWSALPPAEVEVGGAAVNTQTETLYVIELAADHARPPGIVTVSADQFSWAVRQQQGFGEVTPVGLIMQPGETAVFEYTPYASAQLGRVDRLTLMVEAISTGARIFPVEVWNWETGAWELVELIDYRQTLMEPARLLGPDNRVRLRVNADQAGGYVRAGRLVIEQVGAF